MRGTMWASGNAYSAEGGLNVAGLRLARRRRQLELQSIEELLPSIDERAKQQTDEDNLDYYGAPWPMLSSEATSRRLLGG